MADDPATTHRRRSLAHVVEAALYFFGVANEEQFDCLLDDAEQRTMLRDWLRSTHRPRDAASVADHDTQTTAVSMVDVFAAAAPTTREVGSMATYSPSGVRLVSAESQTPVVCVVQRASQANVAVPVADAAVGAAACMADAPTQCVVETANASTSHYLVPGLGLTVAATQTGLDVAALEETLASTLSALDSSQAAQRTLEQRVEELEGQLSSLAHSADATTQTELNIEGFEESLLQAALGAQDAPVEQYHFESDSEMMIIDENSYWQKDSEGVWREREGQPTV